ncbi:MAG: hypothetical protein IJV22_06210 [Bacteroidales bacterium]|nr:hypothetical protein [Bacteroidales bacterium]
MVANKEYNIDNTFSDLNLSVTDIIQSANTNITISANDIKKAKDVLDVAVRREELESKRQDREQRRKFAVNIFWVVVAYLSLTLCIVTLYGASVLCFKNDAAIILTTLLGTTTANVITLLVIVVKYLFRTKD